MCDVGNPVHAQVHTGTLAQHSLLFSIFLGGYRALHLLRFLFAGKCYPTCAFSRAPFERLPTQIVLQQMFLDAVHYFFSVVKF